MKRTFKILIFLFILLIFMTGIQGKWDIYLLKGISYYHNIKDNINSSNVVYSIDYNSDSKPEINTEEVVNTIKLNEDKLNVLGLGDSLTKGFGSDNGKGYFHLFIDYLEEKGIEVESNLIAKKGRASTGLIDSVQEDNQEYIEDADLILITIGGNDIMRVVKEKGFSVTLDDIMDKRSSFRDNLEQTIETINSINEEAKIVIIGLYNPFLTWIDYEPEPFKALTLWNEEYTELEGNYRNTYYIPIEDLFEEDAEDMLYEDRFHPNSKGYEEIANRLIDHFEIIGDES